MAGNKYIANNNGTLTEVVANQTSAGAADAGKIVALDAGGKLDPTLLPTGVGADSQIITASEALAAGDLVNIWDNGGAFNVRKADASTSGKEAHGFVLSNVAQSGAATVYFEGTNTQCTGLTPGRLFLSASAPGKPVNASPVGAGKITQIVGFAISATAMNFQFEQPITLA